MFTPQPDERHLVTLPPHARSRAFAQDIGDRLLKGSHLVLYGPRGTAKTSLLADLQHHFRICGVPCGLAAETSGLPDIIAALCAAYPTVNTHSIGRRAARVRLRTAAMLGYLRRLRGGIAGALLVVDVDSANERERLRSWHAGALAVRMPLQANLRLKKLLLARIDTGRVTALERRAIRYLVRSARGRVGWIEECVRRLGGPDYLTDDRLNLAAVCMDVEMALRQARLGPRAGRN